MSSTHSETLPQRTESGNVQNTVNHDGKSNNPSGHSTLFGLAGSLFKEWTDASMINYFTDKPLDYKTSAQSILRRRTLSSLGVDHSTPRFDAQDFEKIKEEDVCLEEFLPFMTSLMNEHNYWGYFYIFPEAYADVYSPVVRIRNVQDVPELVGGELTRDMVTACLTYLKRTPILGDFVYIKLDLSSKHLMNIDVLQYYKFLVYLDLSSNLLTSLTVLSYLPYLQYLSVAFNRLSTVLDYKTPQWFLTEVYYKYNSVKKIRDLNVFWSITILDLSHNNIKCITGLEKLSYLRRLDLSFNHIQRLENLNHLRLLWLDVSYNNISSCEFSANAGLWTLLHLEYLNLSENNLTSMKMFSYCTRLRELHLRNNRLSMLFELAVYMRQMRRLIVLDLRANPICSTPGYKSVVISTFSILLSLDAKELDPIEQRTLMMEMKPEINMHATWRLLRLLYIQQLSKARVSPYIPPADSKDVPIVVLVGHEGVGKGALARRLATECSANIELAYQHTTATYHLPDHYREITRNKFDDMLLAGDFLTYTEFNGESYGLSREEAFVKEGKVKIVTMDLLGALLLKLRGYRPYMILVTCKDTYSMIKKQQLRKTHRNTLSNQERLSQDTPLDRSTLHVMLSGRIIITGIINEILLDLPDDKAQSEFVMESECSLLMDSDARQTAKDNAKVIDMLAFINSSDSSLDVIDQRIHEKGSMDDKSLYSLFKGSLSTAEYTSYINGQNQGSYQSAKKQSRSKQTDKHSNMSQCHRLLVQDSSKSSRSKSVTFTSQDVPAEAEDIEVTGMMVEPAEKDQKESDKAIRSISTRMPWASGQSRPGSRPSTEDSDLWLAFLTEAGYIQASDMNIGDMSTTTAHHYSRYENDTIMLEMNDTQLLSEFPKTYFKDRYESIHRRRPGLFWDSVTMDDPEQAFIKLRGIIRNIVKSQKTLKPMYNIDFANMTDYPTVQKRLIKIRNQIAPQQLFY